MNHYCTHEFLEDSRHCQQLMVLQIPGPLVMPLVIVNLSCWKISGFTFTVLSIRVSVAEARHKRLCSLTSHTPLEPHTHLQIRNSLLEYDVWLVSMHLISSSGTVARIEHRRPFLRRHILGLDKITLVPSCLMLRAGIPRLDGADAE